MAPKTYSTPMVAKLLGVNFLTLHRWIKAGKIRPEGIQLPDGRVMWLWTEADIAKAESLKDAYKRHRK